MIFFFFLWNLHTIFSHSRFFLFILFYIYLYTFMIYSLHIFIFVRSFSFLLFLILNFLIWLNLWFLLVTKRNFLLIFLLIDIRFRWFSLLIALFLFVCNQIILIFIYWRFFILNVEIERVLWLNLVIREESFKIFKFVRLLFRWLEFIPLEYSFNLILVMYSLHYSYFSKSMKIFFKEKSYLVILPI